MAGGEGVGVVESQHPQLVGFTVLPVTAVVLDYGASEEWSPPLAPPAAPQATGDYPSQGLCAGDNSSCPRHCPEYLRVAFRLR